MPDEDINIEEVEETPQEETPEEQIEETPEEVVEPEETPEETPEEEPEEAPKPSRRESLRIQKLIEKLKNNSQTEVKVPSFDGLDYKTTLDADEEVITKLDEDRKKYAEQAYSSGLEQAKTIQFETRLDIDLPKVLSKYGQLDPENKEHFNPALADAINTWYINTAGYEAEDGNARVANPNLRYAEFVDGIFELANEIAGEKVQKTVKNIAKQAATTGLRPDGSSAKRLDLNKPLGAMSDAELAAYGKRIGLN